MTTPKGGGDVHRMGSAVPSEPTAANTTNGSTVSTAAVGASAAVCELRVGGMDCASCATAIERALRNLEGVEDVRVDVVGGKVRVGYAEGKLARGDLAGTIRRVGYTVEEADDRTSRRAAFAVDGMDCADEVRLIEGKLGNLPGVTALQFDVVRHRLVVEGAITAPEVQRAIKDLGMTARGEGEEAARASFRRRRGRLLMTAAAGVGVALGLAAKWAGLPQWVEVALLAVATAAGGWFVVPRGVRAALNRALDMNFLMSVAAAGAWAIGEPEEAAATLFLFAVAELLESYSMDRARNAIKALMDLSPAEATVRRNGAEVRVSVTEVAVGETVVVRPGEKLAIDGEVTGGRSGVNQAPITGESMPVDKAPGDEVFAGSLNGQGVLEVRSTKPASDTTLARIIHAVEEAQASRAPSQTFVDRFARVYTPAVVLVAVLIAVVPPLTGFGGQAGAWDVWVYRALAMLVVACPCALVISTPVSIVSGLAGAARAGILIKGGAHLEHLGAVTVVAFDKTGTLTQGRPAVTDVVALSDRLQGGITEAEVLRLALGVERHSEHPIARAVLEHGRALRVTAPPASDFEALVGRGARASTGGETIYVGNEWLGDELGVATTAARALLDRFEREGKTAVLVATSREPLGVLAIADRIRPEAPAALAALRAVGVRRTVMLTGDNAGTARAVAAELGVDEVHAALLPEDKVRIVRELEARGERVAFVGDGVNDAPALAAATVGVAMGAAGTDVALETADVALMGDDLSKLAETVRRSRTTLGVIKQNVAFAIAIKAVFLVLAVGGWATLWMAVAADMGASLAVVANGLRALRDPRRAHSAA
jgi:Zn2+/Cd2+-exporting ATPase